MQDSLLRGVSCVDCIVCYSCQEALPGTQVWVPTFLFLGPKSKNVVKNPSTDMVNGILFKKKQIVKVRNSFF
jgi:hypothetical protein